MTEQSGHGEHGWPVTVASGVAVEWLSGLSPWKKNDEVAWRRGWLGGRGTAEAAPTRAPVRSRSAAARPRRAQWLRGSREGSGGS